MIKNSLSFNVLLHFFPTITQIPTFHRHRLKLSNFDRYIKDIFHRFHIAENDYGKVHRF
jgi:hypothetical protein